MRLSASNLGPLRHGLTPGVPILALLAALFALALCGVAGAASSAGASAAKPNPRPLVPTALQADASAHPAKSFRVIVQGAHGVKTAKVAAIVRGADGRTIRRFVSISGVDASVSGKTLLRLARDSRLRALTPNAFSQSESQRAGGAPANAEMWR